MDKDLEYLLSNTADTALKRRAKWIIENLSIRDGARILDLGCGDGFYVHLLSNLGLHLSLYGVDYDRHALKSAKKNLSSKIKLIRADLMGRLPFPDDFFDGIVLSEVMEHLPDDIKCMKEVRRILKKQGKVVMSVPNINFPLFWDPVNWFLQRLLNYHIKSGFWAGIWNQHLRLYSYRGLSSVLEKSGFKKIKIAELTHYCLPFNHHLINLGARIIYSKDAPVPLKKKLSKFNPHRQKNFLSPFWLLAKFDSLNNRWDGIGSAVSLVASAEK